MLYDLCSFSTATPGTGTITAGSAVSGFRSLATCNGGTFPPDGTEVEYAIHDGTDKETGTGITGASGTTLTRVLSQSTTGALLNLSGAATVRITPIAARLVSKEADGDIRSATNAFANPVVVPLFNWMMLNSNYTLTNAGTEQKAFNTTANGRLALPTGIYRFDWFMLMSSMSATSGNASFDPIGAGTAVTDRWGQDSYGLDNNTNTALLAIGGGASKTQQTGGNAVVAATGTGLRVRMNGVFRISTAGTIIPSVTLATAASAVVEAGSYFVIMKIGDTGEASVGAWD